MIGESKSDSQSFIQRDKQVNKLLEIKDDTIKAINGLQVLAKVIRERDKLIEFINNRGLLDEYLQSE